MEKFKNKNVIVTGAAEGVGREIAIEYAKEGAFVILVDLHKPEETMKIIKNLGGNTDYILCDISKEYQVKKMGAQVQAKFNGKVDVLVNNAGFNGKINLIQDMKLADWEYTLGINLTGTMLMCREIIPYLIANQSGCVVNVSSNVGKRGLPYRSDYVCSKWALIGFTQTLALELVGHNIRVNAVCPGPVEGQRIEQLVKMHAEVAGQSIADMHKAWEDVPMKRFVTPQEVTKVILFLSSDDSSAMTGQALNVTGGLLMN
jgi:NAD(P)-dependent dehydrogenase (short-subunit alcohol dehydrogenase family)